MIIINNVGLSVSCYVRTHALFEISDSHGDDYEDSVLGYSAV
jgi:hypothetical protein